MSTFQKIPSKTLVVGRDRAHVKTLTARYAHAEVVSASAFFDKVRLFAFVANKKLQRDDFAPVVMAQKILRHDERFGERFIANFCSLYAAFYHGTSPPISVVPHLPEDDRILPVVKILAQIDEAMRKQSLVTGVSALFHAWEAIKHQQAVPKSLLRFRSISLQYLVDLTVLEIEVIKDLSRLGVSFDVSFPMDFQKRGLNVAVDFSAKQFESASDLMNVDLTFENIAHDGPLLPLVEGLFSDTGNVVISDKHCSIETANDVLAESDLLAQNVLYLLTNHPDETIAVCVRSIDSRSNIYKRALNRYGISVRDRKGIALLATKAGLLLENIFSARSSHLAKRDLVGLMNNPLSVLHVSDEHECSRMNKLLSDLGIDDRFVVEAHGAHRYRKLLALFRARLLENDERLASLDAFESWLLKAEQVLSTLHEHATLKNNLAAVVQLIKTTFVGDDSSIEALIEAISAMARSVGFAQNDDEMALADFVHLLKTQLASITVPHADNEDLFAVELLLLPETLGRRFDHVLIADISFGRMPQNSSQDPLLDDQARMLLNQRLKKPLLRVFFDDPFEPLPVPPRQALEPFWFASALCAARRSVHFSCALRDENGQEQAPSEFFVWLVDHVKLVKERHARTPFVSPEYLRFLQGQKEQQVCIPQSEMHAAIHARKLAFSEGLTGEYAFSFGQDAVAKSFAGRLDEQPTRALTPTTVENFSACRFKGLSERIMNIAPRLRDADDIDARGIGQIAHRALELYFGARDSHREPTKSEMLRKILHEVGAEFSKDNFVLNEMVLACHLEWLHDALLGLIASMEEQGLDPRKTIAQEIALGLGASRKAIVVLVEGRKYLLGGRIDRIDRAGQGFVVIDYKLSSTDVLKSELNTKNMLHTHFQVPIYVRLVAENFADHDPNRVQFSFASIRDGKLLPLISAYNFPELFERIFDRTNDGLAPSIDRIFSPLRRGEVLATVGDHCASCDFTYFCRKTEERSL